MASVRIQSTFTPPKSEQLNPMDWELYRKVWNIAKVRTIRRLNNQLNQVLAQSFNRNTA